MGSLYSVSNLGFAYKKGEPVFANVSLEIPAQGVTVITGKNGAGKTTFCRLLTGLTKGYEGKLLLQGSEITGLESSRIMDKVLYIKQDLTGSLMGVTPGEDLKIWQNRFSEPDSESKSDLRREALWQLGIEEKFETPLWEMSYGQKRRTMLAVLPLLTEKYWIIDEPTASLDLGGIELLIDVIRKKKEGEAGILILTHRPLLFEELTDLRFEIREGRIVPVS